MRAAVTVARDRVLALEERPDPTPGPGQLVVAVSACGICGSDLHLATLGLPGIVFGHEFAGEVVATGPGEERHAVGDLVVGFPLVSCGRCDACRAGVPSHCPSAETIGIQRPGAYAELVLTESASTWPLPPELDTTVGALVEPLAVAHHGLDALSSDEGAVLVLGGGPVGQAALLWLRLRGRAVVVSDPVASRRTMAEQLGAVAVVDPMAEDVRAAFERATGGPPRSVLECVGVPGLLQHATDVAASLAEVVVLGACIQPDPFVPATAVVKELSFRFVSYYGAADFDATIAAFASGGLDPSPLVTGTVGLDDLPARFESLHRPTDDCKVLVTP